LIKNKKSIAVEPFFLISLEGLTTNISVSDNIFGLIGYRAESFLSGEISLKKLIHTKDDDISDFLFSNKTNIKSGSHNLRMRHNDGHIICLKADYKKSSIGKGHTLELILKDPKALWKNKITNKFTNEFISMMENTNDYIYFKDRNHVFTGASQTLVNLTSASKHWRDLLGKTDYDVFPEEYADISYNLEKQVFSGVSIAHETQETLDNSGKKGWVDNRKYPILNEEKKIIGLFGIARDITDSIIAQERLKLSKKKLIAANQKNQQLLNYSGEGIYGLDINGHTTFVNSVAQNMLGYTLQEMKNKSQHDLIHHSRPDGTPYPLKECKIYLAFKTGVVQHVSDEYFWRKDGSSFPVEYTITPIIDDGIIQDAVVTFSDITNRLESENALKISENWFRTIFEESPLGVALIESISGNIIEVNNHFCEIAGRSKKDIQVLNWVDFTHPDDINKDLENYKDLNSGKVDSFKIEKRFIRADRTEGWISKTVTKFLVGDKTKPIHLAMIEDITESKQIQETLLLSEKRFRIIFEESPLGVALIDSLTGHIYEVNPRFAEIAGRSLEEMANIDWMSITHPDDVQEDLDSMAALNAGKISGFKMEKRYIKPDDSHVWISMTIAPITVVDKTPPRHLCMIEDITQRKKIEEELKNYQNHLEEEMSKRTLELKKSQEKLIHSEKLSTLGKFAGTVAHEFNNPLFGVINLIEQIEEGVLDDERKTFTKLAKKECWRMANMIKNLQSFYKPSEESFTINSMYELVEEVLLIAGKACKNKGITIHKVYKTGKYSFEGIEDQIKQVILNIINNSIESILDSAGKITLKMAETSTDILLEIQDTGSGIDQENLNFIFDPFFTTKGKEGTGLGLSVSYGIIKKHGGDILIESELGIGSTVTLVIPITRII
jgi:PAS domain S-box-containing protein